MEDKTFIQLGAMVVHIAAAAVSFSKRENAGIHSCLLFILGFLMLIYGELQNIERV